MADPMLVRFFLPEHGARLGLRLGDQVHDITAQVPTPGAWLRSSVGRVAEAIRELEAFAPQTAAYPTALFEHSPTPDHAHWLAPVLEQDVWAAGVTYERSREARQQEAIDGGDIYSRVYRSERPELFFKAHGRSVIGPLGEVGIRSDAAWSVPEPELALVLNPALEVAGLAVGNDMSSRDIEGANPLYLPQAKIYTGSCALGPGIVLRPAAEWPHTAIRLAIRRAGQTVFTGETSTARLVRTITDLCAYLGRSSTYPDGVVLLTGTGIVPPAEFTLAAGDEVEITIDGIGTLVNRVRVV